MPFGIKIRCSFKGKKTIYRSLKVIVYGLLFFCDAFLTWGTSRIEALLFYYKKL